MKTFLSKMKGEKQLWLVALSEIERQRWKAKQFLLQVKEAGLIDIKEAALIVGQMKRVRQSEGKKTHAISTVIWKKTKPRIL